MKRKSNSVRSLVSMLLFLLVIGVYAPGHAQESTPSDFKITIEPTRQGLKMESHNGSAWIDLEFNLGKNELRVVNQYGMTEEGKHISDRNPKFTNYLFAVQRTKNEIILTGIEGTVWKNLSLPVEIHEKVTIDKFGISK